MKLNKVQLRYVIGLLSEVSKFSVKIKTSNSELIINFNNIAHQTKINDEVFGSASEKVDNLGRYCLNEFFYKEESLDIKSIIADNTELINFKDNEDTNQYQLVASLINYTLTANPKARVMCIMKKGKSKLELNSFDTQYVYRKYISPDNNSVIVFKNSVGATIKQLKDYTLESLSIYKDTLTEKKFRHYQYDASKASGKSVRFVDTYKEGSA